MSKKNFGLFQPLINAGLGIASRLVNETKKKPVHEQISKQASNSGANKASADKTDVAKASEIKAESNKVKDSHKKTKRNGHLRKMTASGLAETLQKVDISKIVPDDRGVKIIADIKLTDYDNPDVEAKYIAIELQYLPGDEKYQNDDVRVVVVAPFTERIPLNDLTQRLRQLDNSVYYVSDDKEAFLISNSIHDQIAMLRGICGVQSGETNIDVDRTDAKKVMENIREATKSGRFDKREDGYYDDTQEYWYNGIIYHEKDVIWVKPPTLEDAFTNGFQIYPSNFDRTDTVYRVCDITNVKDVKIENSRRVLSNRERFEAEYYGTLELMETPTPQEYAWWLAKQASTKISGVAFALVCVNGQLLLPVEAFYNPVLGEFDYLIVPFNAQTCSPENRRCAGILGAGVGNLDMVTYFRYRSGSTIDWHKRFDQELAAYRKISPNYNPFGDFYDEPGNSNL